MIAEACTTSMEIVEMATVDAAAANSQDTANPDPKKSWCKHVKPLSLQRTNNTVFYVIQTVHYFVQDWLDWITDRLIPIDIVNQIKSNWIAIRESNHESIMNQN